MKFQKFVPAFLLLFLSLGCVAQTDSSGIRISLLTCGTGPMPWETFGHTAIRITDTMAGTDNVYNYGTFDGYDDDFLINFARGKLLYYLSYYPYSVFIEEYQSDNRSVSEQVLLLNATDKIKLYNFLIHNARPENKYYKYDFFYDNCATRIRDAFPRAFGKGFEYAHVLPDTALSFRNIINRYFYRVHWQRFGVNILLGSKIDKKMTNKDIMFLPDYLEQAVAGSQLHQKPAAAPSKTIITGMAPLPTGINGPLILMAVLALLSFTGLYIRGFEKLGKIMSFLVLFLSGFIGCFILVMWLATDHQGCNNNFNLLWALPVNIVFAFLSKKNKDRYAWVAIMLIFVSIALHLLKVQELPLLEITPFFLALLFIYGSIIHKAKNQIKNGKDRSIQAN